MEIQNFILFATRDEKEPLNFSEEKILKNNDEIIRELPEKLVNLSNFNFTNTPILTDDFAPVEYLTAEMIKFKQF